MILPVRISRLLCIMYYFWKFYNYLSCYCMQILTVVVLEFFFFFFKQKTAYEVRIRDWSSDVCSSDLRMIDEGIAAVMRLPREDRSLDALRTMLGMADAGGIGARLEKWTSRGSMGWVFDNAADEMTLDARFIGFDMTDFLDNADVRTPLM